MKKFTLLATLVMTMTLPAACDSEDYSDFRGIKKPGCTRTLGWYKNHPQSWPVSPSLSLCGQTLMDVLQTPPEGDHWLVLSHQFVTALLNVMNGAYADPEVTSALVQAQPFVWGCTVPKESVELASTLTETLDAFNNGLLSAPHCDDLSLQ